MSSPGKLSLRRLFPFAAAVVLLGLGAAWFYVRIDRARHVRPGAYLVAVDASSRVRIDGWWATRLPTSRPVGAGRAVKIPAGSTVKIVYPDGRAEVVVGPKRIQIPAAAPPDELDFLRSPLAQIVAQAKLADNSDDNAVLVTSPVGVTRFLNPTLAWTTREGVDYNVVVRDPTESDAPVRVARRARPPIALAQLETPQPHELLADRIYEMLVTRADSDTVIGGARFLTRADATADAALPVAPADLLAEAAAAMAKLPTRTGDAWLALSRLPPEWRACELAVRLRLRVAGELGLADEFAQAKQAAVRFQR